MQFMQTRSGLSLKMKDFMETGSGLSLKNNDETSWHKNMILVIDKLNWKNLVCMGHASLEENIKRLKKFVFWCSHCSCYECHKDYKSL